jgi:hypothetical protein
VSFEGKHTLANDTTKLDYNVAAGEAVKRTPDRQDWEFRSGKYFEHARYRSPNIGS